MRKGNQTEIRKICGRGRDEAKTRQVNRGGKWVRGGEETLGSLYYANDMGDVCEKVWENKQIRARYRQGMLNDSE